MHTGSPECEKSHTHPHKIRLSPGNNCSCHVESDCTCMFCSLLYEWHCVLQLCFCNQPFYCVCHAITSSKPGPTLCRSLGWRHEQVVKMNLLFTHSALHTARCGAAWPAKSSHKALVLKTTHLEIKWKEEPKRLLFSTQMNELIIERNQIVFAIIGSVHISVKLRL